METDEETLIDQLRHADPAAYHWLHLTWERPLRKFIWRLVGNTWAEDDIIQDAFYAVYQQARSGRKIENLRAFLYRTVRNRCYDELRRRKSHPHISFDEEMAGVHSMGYLTVHSLQEDRLLRDELYREVKRAIHQLPELQRQTFILHVQEELPYAEIAHIMNVDIGTVKSRLHYAKKFIRKQFAKQEAKP